MSALPTTVEAARATAARAGIHRIPLPTPFLVGPVNCYLIEDDPLTLVDTGPNSGRTLDALERALGALGRSIEELELIVLTHQHVDHIGLVDVLVRRSGAEVAALDLLVPYLADYGAAVELDDRFALALMRRHGIPADVTEALRALAVTLRGWGAGATVTRPLTDGGRLELAGRTLEVHHRPGHSPSDTVLWDPDRELLIAGDHLIAHISSNPLVARPLSPTGNDPADPIHRRPHALGAYQASLELTRAMPARVVLPGHGEPLVDHVALIDERAAATARRARKIHRLLAEGPQTAYEIAQRMWGTVAISQAYLTLSEVLGHLDLLCRDGRARELDADDDGVVRFVAR